MRQHPLVFSLFLMSLFVGHITGCEVPQPQLKPLGGAWGDQGGVIEVAGVELSGTEADAGMESAGTEVNAGAGVEVAGIEVAGVEAGTGVEVAGMEAGAGVEVAGIESAGMESAGTEAGEPSPPPCEPALAISPTSRAVLPFDLVSLTPSGGSGRYRFTLLDAPSGGLINELTGAYLAGGEVGVSDLVRLSDEGCEGEALASLSVVEPLKVSPSRPEVARGQSLQFVFEGGSGEVRFELVSTESGGQVSPEGRYLSGDQIGEDRLEVIDVQTGERTLALISVVPVARLTVTPQHLWLPVGAEAKVEARGGSGVYDLELRPAFTSSGTLPPALPVIEEVSTGEELVIRASAVGEGELWVKDRFLGVESPLRLQTLESLSYESARNGKIHRATRTLALPDADGDGVDELIVAIGELDKGATEAGAVYLYHSATRALVQSWSTEEPFARFGRSVTVGDWTGDGVLDLAIGAYLADVDGPDRGAIYLYTGLAGGLFADEPLQVLAGGRNGDQHGIDVDACDVNGDGWTDMIVGAYAGEGENNQYNTQGVVRVYLHQGQGAATPYLPDPDQTLEGQVLIDGVWTGERNLRFGAEVATGDVNGDGLCDLAVSAPFASGLDQEGDDGRVYLYVGQAASEESLGGVTPLPVDVLEPSADDPDGRFGWRLWSTDLNADGRDEMIVSQYRSHRGGNDVGSLYAFGWGTELSTAPATSYTNAVSAALWVLDGTRNFEYFGVAFDARDLDGDGYPELAVGAYNSESSGRSNTGKVWVYQNVSGAPAEEPFLEVEGLENQDNLGETVTLLGGGQLATYAGQDKTLGVNLGRPYWVSERPAEEVLEGELPYVLEGLDYPGDIGGTRYGLSMSLQPNPNLSLASAAQVPPLAVVGAPYMPRASVYYTRAGGAVTYRLSQDQSRFESAQLLQEHEGHTPYDLYGEGSGAPGDFDGDGSPEFAVSARADERPGTFAPWVEVSGVCPDSGSQTGAVFLFSGAELSEGQPISLQPRFVLYGVERNDEMHVVAGEVDLNNDGYDDVIVGGPYADTGGTNSGVLHVYFGEPAPALGGTKVICEPSFTLRGSIDNAWLGASVAGMPDLNGDGCDELVVGAPRADVGEATRQGVVHLIYGWGGTGCQAEPWVASFTAGGREDRFGTSVSSAQLDGVGRYDLAVSAFNADIAGERRGAVYVLKAPWLNALPMRRASSPLVVHDLNAYFNAESPWWRSGELNGERFGWALKAANGTLFVSAPYWGNEQVSRAGEARLFSVSAEGISPAPFGRFLGETWSSNSQLGDTLDMRNSGGHLWLGLGSQYSSSNYATGGGAYVGWLPQE